MTPPVAGFVLLPVTNGDSAENGPSSHFQISGSLGVRSIAPPHHQLMRDSLVHFSRSRLVTAVSRHLLPNRRQGDPASRRTDHPSQDRRSLGYLVSSPPLATNDES